MNKKAIIAAILVLLVLLYVSILSDSVLTADQNKNCIYLCSLNSQESNWNAGPCLAEAGQNGMAAGWVCDVAKNPRQDIDNLPANQCATYGPGKHFVEVGTDCKFIRAV